MTLQQQYNLIKEGKGNKEHFLKQARHLFPEYLTVHNTYEQTIGILQGKSIISEAAGGVVTLDNKKPDWFKIFNENLSSSDTPKHKIIAQLLGPDFFLSKKPESQWDDKDHDLFNRVFKMASEEGKVPKLNEAIGVKNTKEYGDQNEFEKIDSETQKTLDKTNFDYKDPKNIDNVYGQTFLNGYYTEMKDPKNSEKTVDELKQIVAKNLVKDINYYVKDGVFGVKGLGYSSEPTGGEPKAPKGKYKSSGYGDLPKAKVVKEGMDKQKELIRHEIIRANGKKEIVNLDKKFDKEGPFKNVEYHLVLAKGDKISPTKEGNKSLNEAKKLTIQKRIQELEKQNEIQALESKIASISEAIEELQSRLALTETDEMKELIDPGKLKEIQKEIKILEKYKAKCEKIYEKLSKGKKSAPSDEDMINEYFDSKSLNENENPISRNIENLVDEKGWDSYDDVENEVEKIRDDFNLIDSPSRYDEAHSKFKELYHVSPLELKKYFEENNMINEYFNQ
jgi:hypothetical protein